MAISVESFESIAITANSPLYPSVDHFIMLGYISPFTFPSGMRGGSPIGAGRFPLGQIVSIFSVEIWNPTSERRA